MANKVTVQILGGSPQVLDSVTTVADIKAKLGVASYTASINGGAASDRDVVDDYSYVTLSPAVKGGSN